MSYLAEFNNVINGYTEDDAQRAIAYATMALVEEVRTANLLALAALLPADSMGSTSERAELLRLVRAEMELS